MGLTRLGALIRFIPVSIVIGFTNGIAVLILLSQVKDFLGLDITMPDEFFSRMQRSRQHRPRRPGDRRRVACMPRRAAAVAEGDHDRRPGAGGRGSTATPRRLRMTGATARSSTPCGAAGGLTRCRARSWCWSLARSPSALLGLEVETIGTRFGGIPRGLPALALPAFAADAAQPRRARRSRSRCWARSSRCSPRAWPTP